MRKSSRRNPKIPAIVLFLLSLGGCIGELARNPQAESRDVVEALRERVSDVRGLKFTAPVSFAVESRDGIKDLLESNLGRGPGGKSMDTSLAYAKLGLVPRGTDLRTGSLNYYSAQTLAFYDSERKRIVYVGSLSDRQGMLPDGAERIIVHELTHALQDQHFALGDRLRSLKNSDAALSLRSLAEGDAMVTEQAYSFGGLTEGVPDYVRQVLDGTEDGQATFGAPAMVADKLRFQYWAGARFVLHFIGKNSWLPIDLIYQRPPLSTAQILHPEKYFAAPDPPTEITLNGLSGLFAAEWTEIENDTLGELMVQCLAKQYLGPEAAAEIATGWNGDRFIAYRNGDDVAFIWATLWDSVNDAREFSDGYRKIAAMKNRSQPSSTEPYVEVRDRAVIVLEGLDGNQVENSIGAVWAKMELQKTDFQPPPLASWDSKK